MSFNIAPNDFAKWRSGFLFDPRFLILILIGCFSDHPWCDLNAMPSAARRIPTRKADGRPRNLEVSNSRNIEIAYFNPPPPPPHKSVYVTETPRARCLVYFAIALRVIFYYGVSENRALLAN